MDMTTIEIPTELLHAAKLTPEEARTELAIRLYQHHKLSDIQACELAGDLKAIETLAWTHQETGHFEMDDFLSWASHDLKTPLNAVIGFTKVVIKGYDGPVTETQVTDLTTVSNSGQRMLGLINNLVEIARINKGEIALAREEADIASLISEYAERWKSQNPAKPVAINIQIVAPTFQVDFQQLRQIINHLLTFAALRVTEGSISLSASDNAEGLTVTIQSTGKKAVDKSEMDSAMHNFITSSLIKLHGGALGKPFETDDGLLLTFSLPR